jgi:Uncharacterized conserved protein (DUF2303).
MENSENNTAAKIVKDLALAQVKDIEIKNGSKTSNRATRHYAVVSDGARVSPLEFLDAKVPQNSNTFIDADSFASYMKAYLNVKESRMFASLGGLTLSGIIDYQPVNAKLLPSDAVDGEKKHKAFFRLVETEDFKAWKAISGQALPQESFVEFLQERLHCIASPDQADILEIARNLEIKTDVTFSSKERSSDGGYNLVYREDVNASAGEKGKIKVPEQLTLKIVAFEGGAEMELTARMYYRMTSGKVVFAIKILNLRETVLKTFRGVCDKISKDVSLDVHYTE